MPPMTQGARISAVTPQTPECMQCRRVRADVKGCTSEHGPPLTSLAASALARHCRRPGLGVVRPVCNHQARDADFVCEV